MERAAYLTGLDGLLELPASAPQADRLYFGQEFCERKLPSRDQLARALAWAREHDLRFTLMTPPLTDDGIDAVERLLTLLEADGEAHEVVVSDFGLLHVTARRHPGVAPVLGRLLARQRRDPRLVRLMKGDGSLVPASGRLWQHVPLPPDAVAIYDGCLLEGEGLAHFLHGLGVRRVELDNVAHGLALTLPETLKASLHVPWGCVATTRRCHPYPGMHPAPFACLLSSCEMGCETTYELRTAGLDEPLYKRGGTVFFRNPKLPPAGRLAAARVDRIVTAASPPL